MSKNIFIGISIALIAGIFWIVVSEKQSSTKASAESVTEKDGIQYITILASGGYSPNSINAKAGMPTKLIFETKGTYDCSSAVSIPKLNYRNQLPADGTTTIDISADQASSNLDIVCAMGMFKSKINFISQPQA